MSNRSESLPLTFERLAARHCQQDSWRLYAEELLAQNQRVNLVSRETSADQLLQLIAESVVPLEIISVESIRSYLDVGSGGGLPAIPIKLSPVLERLDPARCLLVERRQKKAAALRRICLGLGIRTEIAAESLEQVPGDTTYDLITMRAVALSRDLLSQITGRLSKTGQFVYFDDARAICDDPSLRIEIARYSLVDQGSKRLLSIVTKTM